MPILFAASRPATATLSQIRYLNPDSCINLHRPTQIDTTKTTSSSAATPSANAFDPVASDHMPHPRRSNPHSARGTDTRTPSAVSSLGGFRTPAASARGTVRHGRHPKTFTNADVGTIFAIFVYVWRLMEKLDMMPQIVQQLMRLKDIRRRIEAGASIEAIGEQIQRTGTDKSGSP